MSTPIPTPVSTPISTPIMIKSDESFTFDNPHVCRHCQNVCITVVAESSALTTCFDCLWKGVGELSGNHRLCGQCGKPYINVERRDYSANLSVTEAATAANEGCALYVWLFHQMVATIAKREDWHLKTVLPSAADYNFRLWTTSFASYNDSSIVLHAELSSTHPETLLDLGDLRCWTTEADPAARFTSSRPYERDIKSAKSINFGRNCFRECLENHGRCKPSLTDKADRDWRVSDCNVHVRETVDIAHVPSRLISVGPEDKDEIKLVEIGDASNETKNDISKSGFAVLSYCWGGNQSFTLTSAIHRDFKTRIPVDSLPQTLQDAVWVARTLGVRYLWIDALCIIQDNDNDKTSEIARMSKYYGYAILTICAAAASKSTEGFLQIREPAPFAFGPVRLQLRDSEGRDLGNLYALEEANTDLEPTSTRGWTMQESLLSRRILIFARRQLYWSCVNSFAGCGGDNPKLVNRMSDIKTLVDAIHPAGSLLDLPIQIQWQEIVEQYTRRRLAFPADKLPAVSALVDYLMQLSSERAEGFEYHAGLFVKASDPTSWIRQLLWYSTKMGNDTKRLAPPEWSWAAVDCAVRFVGFIDSELRANMATVVDVSVNVTVPSAPFGCVRGGTVVVNTKMCSMSESATMFLEYRIIDDWDDRKNSTNVAERIEFFPDTSEELDKIDDEFADAGSGEKGLMVLVCLCWSDVWTMRRAGDVSDFEENVVRAVGLVVVPSDTIEGAFRRIGIFRVMRDISITDWSTKIDFCSFLSLHRMQSLRLV